MNSAKRVYTRFWRGTVVVISLGLLAYLLYFHQLGTLLPGYSKAEVATYTASSDWHFILKNPVNAPYKVFVWLGTAILHHGIIVTRMVAAAYGILAVLAFYLIARLRYRFWMACAGTVLFATSAGFLHAARLGTGVVLQLGILGLIWCVLWYRARPSKRILIGYIAAVLLALLWYVPGMIWFELFALVLLHAPIRRHLRLTSNAHIITWVVLFLGLITPLIWAVAQKPRLGLTAAGLPQNMHTLTQFPHNLLDTILAIGIRSNGSPTFWVGHMPLFNIIELSLAIIGVYTYAYLIRKTASNRFTFVIGSTILAILLISLGGSVAFVCMVPLLYVFVISGLSNLLGQWQTVFPRNPIARVTGALLITLMLFFSVLYQVRSYFVAWPNTMATREEFSHQPKQ
jgi:hypothetical protein